ncbi:MAG: hypothetical protein KME40_09405 [Komarekiella atlantica HA4396-MV6]|nr:hypothetical protein [Komarekiella atlantica HA4396-MV6]
MNIVRTYAQVTEESNHRGTEKPVRCGGSPRCSNWRDTERSLSGAQSLSGGNLRSELCKRSFRRSFAKRAVGKTRSKRSHAAGFTLRYPLTQPAAAKSSVGGFPAVGNFSRQASELREK